jgi:acyl-CoA reductase-like NAD-dependent aldehyde dehydrogenase
MATSVVASTLTQKFLSSSPFKLLVGGRWIPSSDSRTLKTYDPGTGEVLAEFYEATPEDVSSAVDRAAEAFEREGWASLRPNERAIYLHRLADLVEQRQAVIAEIESLDVGKPLPQVQWDVQTSDHALLRRSIGACAISHADRSLAS